MGNGKREAWLTHVRYIMSLVEMTNEQRDHIMIRLVSICKKNEWVLSEDQVLSVFASITQSLCDGWLSEISANNLDHRINIGLKSFQNKTWKGEITPIPEADEEEIENPFDNEIEMNKHYLIMKEHERKKELIHNEYKNDLFKFVKQNKESLVLH